MRHPDASLAAYVEGSATARERSTVEAHLASCPACRREVKRARAAQAALVRLPEVKAPGLDATAIILAATAARAAGRKTSPAAAPTLAVVPAPTEAWAPAAPTAIEEGAEAAEVASDGESVAVEAPPVEDDLTRRKRERDRSRAIRVAETALGAAAVLVAIVLFVGLRNQGPSADRASTAAPQTTTSAPPEAVGGAEAVTDYSPITLSAHAKELVGVINSSGSVSDAQSMPLYARQSSGPKSDTDKGLACIQKGTELLEGTRVYELELASFQGRPAWIGAFIVDADTNHPVLLVLAVSVDGCNPQQVIREKLAAPGRSSSPST
jgi:anti-sigma factor RsiW